MFLKRSLEKVETVSCVTHINKADKIVNNCITEFSIFMLELKALFLLFIISIYFLYYFLDILYLRF